MIIHSFYSLVHLSLCASLNLLISSPWIYPLCILAFYSPFSHLDIHSFCHFRTSHILFSTRIHSTLPNFFLLHLPFNFCLCLLVNRSNHGGGGFILHFHPFLTFFRLHLFFKIAHHDLLYVYILLAVGDP